VKVSFKLRKSSGIYVSILAGLAFIAMAVTRFGLPLSTVLEFVGLTVVLVLAMIAVAAPVALLIRWWSNRRE
jgi:hypothetical protein